MARTPPHTRSRNLAISGATADSWSSRAKWPVSNRHLRAQGDEGAGVRWQALLVLIADVSGARAWPALEADRLEEAVGTLDGDDLVAVHRVREHIASALYTARCGDRARWPAALRRRCLGKVVGAVAPMA
ncbi:hypothetical protein [Streptomyces sp. NPDC059452]|uniref:hypothetical protein n=1 Tax=Streptomyces sp. NPDC059452 TaxID=3346835 RepID=UPI0036B015F9